MSPNPVKDDLAGLEASAKLALSTDPWAAVALSLISQLRTMAGDLEYAREGVRALFWQACSHEGQLDHMCMSIYEGAQDDLLEWGLIKKEDCYRT